MDESGHISNFLVTELIVIQWRKEEVAYTLRVLPVWMKLKKEVRQVNQNCSIVGDPYIPLF